MILLFAGGCRVVQHRVVTRVEVADDRLDRTALARRIGPLEHHEETGATIAGAHLPTEMQPQLQQATLFVLEPLRVLLAIEPLAHVELVEDGHRHRARGRMRERRIVVRA